MSLFDPAGLGDEELFRRQTEIEGKLGYAAGYGSASMVAALQQMLEQIVLVQNDRLARKVWELTKPQTSKAIETDPVEAAASSLPDETAGDDITGPPVPLAPGRPRVTIVKTDTPARRE